jgi:hypothetical protein
MRSALRNLDANHSSPHATFNPHKHFERFRRRPNTIHLSFVDQRE